MITSLWRHPAAVFVALGVGSVCAIASGADRKKEFHYECVSIAGEDAGALLGMRVSASQVRLDYSEACVGKVATGAPVGRGDRGYLAYDRFGACGSKDGSALLILDRGMSRGEINGRAQLMSRGEEAFQTDYACTLRP